MSWTLTLPGFCLWNRSSILCDVAFFSHPCWGGGGDLALFSGPYVSLPPSLFQYLLRTHPFPDMATASPCTVRNYPTFGLYAVLRYIYVSFVMDCTTFQYPLNGPAPLLYLCHCCRVSDSSDTPLFMQTYIEVPGFSQIFLRLWPPNTGCPRFALRAD